MQQLTDWIAQHGVYAVFVLMAIDALLPAGGEIVMLFAGATAAGAVAVQPVSLFGAHLSSGLESYLVLALAGTIGYLVGSLVGWAIGRRGGRPLIERHGRWLHLSPANLARADDWFERFGGLAVFFGRLTPVVRSFVSIPAGAFGTPLAPYTVLTAAGSAIWCFGFAGAGWALGSSWESVHHAFRYADYAVVAAVLAALAAGVWKARERSRRSPSNTSSPASPSPTTPRRANGTNGSPDGPPTSSPTTPSAPGSSSTGAGST
jgi:membrane protein DedA with SNARE-associated domain